MCDTTRRDCVLSAPIFLNQVLHTCVALTNIKIRNMHLIRTEPTCTPGGTLDRFRCCFNAFLYIRMHVRFPVSADRAPQSTKKDFESNNEFFSFV